MFVVDQHPVIARTVAVLPAPSAEMTRDQVPQRLPDGLFGHGLFFLLTPIAIVASGQALQAASAVLAQT
ncbi:hypothetical protein Hsw_PA0004 (plasmid) [Hymenobacter swuensis DY53]|uniref:Uncharacterized protein n=1 Tax=Hymenobacter swuensis DY53 TaxID=1227739 RepID=W8EU87_9BACT|nr:hypothetical protein Hsw_PA0004 [Hymenobacter swuensis DY53]